jgi:starch phosphorylase
MKFALNVALTRGTPDGANVEIRDHVGDESFFFFGMTAPLVVARRATPDHAAHSIKAEPRVRGALNLMHERAFSMGDPARHHDTTGNRRGPDYALVCSDFGDYWRAHLVADVAYRVPARWSGMAALNTAHSGSFSSDRRIWGCMAGSLGAFALLPGA